MANVKIVIIGEDKASEELKKVVEELRGVDKAAQASSTNLSGSFMEMKAKFDMLRDGVEIFAGAFKKAFEWGEQGAKIYQTAESFDFFLSKVGAAPDMLEELRAKAGGTIDDMTLMKSVLTLTAGVTDDFARELTDATPRLVEIARAAQKFNPTLGDMNYMMDSLSLGIKRQSKVILDNLGLTFSAEDAYKWWASEIEVAVEQLSDLDKQTAYLNYTMQVSGEQLIKQVGGVDSATDSFAKLEAAIKNMTDQTKQGLYPVLNDAANALLGIGNIMQGVGFNTTMLTAAWEVMQGLVNDLAMALLDLFYAIKNGELSISDIDGSLERLNNRLDDNGNVFDNALERWNDAVVTSEELAAAQEEAAAAAAKVNAEMTEQNEKAQELVPTLKKLGGEYTDLKRAASEAASGLQTLDWDVQVTQTKKQAEALAEAAHEAQSLAENTEWLRARNAMLSAGMNGVISGVADMNDKFHETTAEMNAVGRQIRDLIVSGVDPNSEAVQKLVTQYETLDDKAKGLVDSMKRTTAEMIFQHAAAGLNADAALKLARSMGLISEQDYAVAQGIEHLRDLYDKNKDGSIDAAEGAMKYSDQIAALNERVQELIRSGQEITQQSIAGAIGASGGIWGGGAMSAAGTPFMPGATSNAYNVQIDAGVLLSFADEQALQDKLGGVIRAVVRNMPPEEIPA